MKNDHPDAEELNETTPAPKEERADLDEGAGVSREQTEAPKGREAIVLEEELMVEEPARVQQVRTVEAPKKSHKGLIITIILTLVLALGAGAVWWFMAGPGKSDEIGSSDDKKEEETGGEEKAEESEEKVEEVALEDIPTGVMEFYQAVGRMNGFTTDYGVEMISASNSQWWFYADEDVARGTIPKYLIIGIAYGNLESNKTTSDCKGEYYFYNDKQYGQVKDQCLEANRIRDKAKEIFDVDLDFDEHDHLLTHDKEELCGTLDYNLEKDEFYTTDTGCGGNDPRRIEHWLTKAEKRGDEVLLYETAVHSDFYQLKKIGPNVDDGEVILDDWDTYSEQEGLDWDARKITDKEITDKFNEYVWKFKKENEKYVFKGLEKVK